MTEEKATKIKRLRMRSMRRGIKEMDLILSAYADANLDRLSDADLQLYDALLSENDHDIYGWITGQADAPDHYANMIETIKTMASGLTRPDQSSQSR